jgi:hypothetical protein
MRKSNIKQYLSEREQDALSLLQMLYGAKQHCNNGFIAPQERGRVWLVKNKFEALSKIIKKHECLNSIGTIKSKRLIRIPES